VELECRPPAKRFGSLDEVSVTPISRQISDLRLRDGHGRKWREVAVPASEIDRLEEATMYLKLDREGVEALLPVQAGRDWR
jgi:hypothetical protein